MNIDQYESEYDFLSSNFSCTYEEHEDLKYRLAEAKGDLKLLKEATKVMKEVINEAKSLDTNRAFKEAIQTLSVIIDDTLEGKPSL